MTAAGRYARAGCGGADPCAPDRNSREDSTMKTDLQGVVALVSGASKGIGLACARALAREGATVVGVSRSAANLEAARARLAAEGLAMHVRAADLVDAAAAAQVVADVEREVGPIGVLVNSAGAAKRYAVDELDAAAFRQAMDAKYFTYVHLMEPVARAMAARGRGSIVNVVGQGGRQAGVLHADKGVRVNAINPGLTRTSRVDEGLEAASRATGRPKDELLAEQTRAIPMGRMGEPEEVAHVAVFLASGLASYVSGAIIPMDGCSASVI